MNTIEEIKDFCDLVVRKTCDEVVESTVADAYSVGLAISLTTLIVVILVLIFFGPGLIEKILGRDQGL